MSPIVTLSQLQSFSFSLFLFQMLTHTHTYMRRSYVGFGFPDFHFLSLRCDFFTSQSLSRNSSLYCMLHVRLQIRSQSNEAISNYFCNSNSNSTMTQVFHALFNHYKAKSFVTFSLWFHFNNFRHWLQMWRCHFVFLSMPKMNSSKQIRRTCNKKKRRIENSPECIVAIWLYKNIGAVTPIVWHFYLAFYFGSESSKNEINIQSIHKIDCRNDACTRCGFINQNIR